MSRLALSLAVLALATPPLALADEPVIRLEPRAEGPAPQTVRPNETYPGLFESDFDKDEGPRPGACVRNPDRKPHGVVEGAVGTGGYRSAGAVVTMPIGDCGQVTLGIEKSQGGYRAPGHLR